MDATATQAAKNEFAKSQVPPIDPCTNSGCKFTGCTCGNKCGCHLEAKSCVSEGDDDGLVRCDPCKEFKQKKKLEMAGK